MPSLEYTYRKLGDDIIDDSGEDDVYAFKFEPSEFLLFPKVDEFRRL